MSMYFPGFQQARDAVSEMGADALLRYIDGLYGRAGLSDNYTLDELRAEAQRQCKEEFTDTRSEEYERTQFYVRLVKLQRDAERLR
jgi:hypothetical protein